MTPELAAITSECTRDGFQFASSAPKSSAVLSQLAAVPLQCDGAHLLVELHPQRHDGVLRRQRRRLQRLDGKLSRLLGELGKYGGDLSLDGVKPPALSGKLETDEVELPAEESVLPTARGMPSKSRGRFAGYRARSANGGALSNYRDVPRNDP
jgi:hypothetical protein